MGYQLFHYEDDALSPEARWFLWQWERYKGLNEPIELPVRALLAEFKIPLRQGQTTLLELKKAGVIEAIPVAKGRGRPSYRYRVAPWLLTTLQELSNAVPSSSSIIEHISQCDEFTNSITFNTSLQGLAEAAYVTGSTDASKSYEETSFDREPSLLESSKEQAGKDKEHVSVSYPNLFQSHLRKGKLTLANRWLLMVLLARSKTLGVVTDLSFTTLQGLTGMSKNSLQSQLKKAKAMGVIAYHQPGHPGNLLGVSMTSIYQLNLAHSLFGRPESEAVAIYLLPPSLSKNHTDLFHGMIDALMAYGVCLAQKERILQVYRKINPEASEENSSEQRSKALNLPSNSGEAILALKKELETVEKVSQKARVLLPSMRQLESTITSLVSTCDATKAEWLRAHVHAEAMYLLASQWWGLGDNDPLPNAPSAEKAPEAALRHRLAHNLANALYFKLVDNASRQNDIEFPELNYTFTPRWGCSGEATPPVWVLRAYALLTNGIAYSKDGHFIGPLVDENLNDYWQAHRSKVCQHK